MLIENLKFNYYRYFYENTINRITKGREKMGKFTRIDTSIEGVYIIEPSVFGDNRGYFMETYS